MNKRIFPLFLILVLSIGQIVSAQKSVQEELQKARDLIMKGQNSESSVILTKIMSTNPNNKEAVQYWLMANMKRTPTGEMDAVLQLDSLGKIYPENTGILFFKNFILAEYGKTEEALAGFTKLTEIQPDTAVNYIGKGQMLTVLNRYEEAAAAFEKALTLDPKRFDVWGMEAAVLAKLKKYVEALVAINKGIDLNPAYAGNIYNRACIYCLKGDKIHTMEDLSTAFAKMPQLKQHARQDDDLKSLWDDEDFKKLTQ